MADFARREHDYNDNLGQVIGRFCTGIVEADSAAKDAAARRVMALVEEPNAEFLAESNLIGMEEKLQTRISVPALAIVQSNPIQIDEAKLVMDMNVSASQTNTTSLDSRSKVEGSGKIGWGPFSIGVKITADVSVGKESKRQSDYRSTTHAEVTMRQGSTPEGLMLIIDSLNKTVSKSLEINQTLIQKKSETLSISAEDAENLNKPELAKEDN